MTAILGVILLVLGALYFFAVPDRPIIRPYNGVAVPPQPLSTTPDEASPKPLSSGTPQPDPPQPNPPQADQSSLMINWSEVERQVFELTNQERLHASVSPLQPEDGLHESARSHSSDMLRRNFFDHVNPSGEDPTDRIGRIHRRMVGTVGENIWAGSGNSLVNDPGIARAIVRAWMESRGHRENILRPKFTHLAVGIVVEGNEIRATQNFASVRAYLKNPLPARVASGSAANLEVESAPVNPVMFDLSAKGNKGRDPTPLPLAGSRWNAPVGTYSLRLYFPIDSDGFEVVPGPQVQID